MRKVLALLTSIFVILFGLWVVDASAAAYPTALGGTGTSITPASGTVLIGNGAGSYTPTLLTPGANIQITNASGSVTIAVTGTATGTVYLLNGGHGISLSPSSITASGTIAVNTSTVIADVLASGQFLSSSTIYVTSVNGQSGVVTIASSSLGVIWPMVNGNQATNYQIVPGTGVTSTVAGATTTISIALNGGTTQTCSASQFINSVTSQGIINCVTPPSSNPCLLSNSYATIQGAINAAASSTPVGCVEITPLTTDTSTWSNPSSVTIIDERQTTSTARFLGGSSINPTLSNFFNGGVASKTIVVFGNSTVEAQGNGYFAQLIPYTALGGNVLYGMDVHSDVNSLSSDASGNITVYTNTSSTDFTVGKFVYLDTTGGGATTTQCFGSGVLTNQSGTSFTFAPVNGGSCTNVAVASATGYATQQILNFGNNGASLAAMLNNTSPTSTNIGGVCAVKPDLLIVRGPLINDVRLGTTNLTQAIALEKQLLDTVRSCSPKTDILLKTENPLLSNDVGGFNYVSPNASASAYSAILEAAPMSFTNTYPNVVTEDTQKLLYGTVTLASSSAPLMNDQLHESLNGGSYEAILDDQVLTNLLNTNYLNTKNYIATPSYVLPTPTTPGTPFIPFSPFLAANARAGNYSAPWTSNPSSTTTVNTTQNSTALDPFACMDPAYYQLIGSGLAQGVGVGSTFFRMSWDGTVAFPVKGGDVAMTQSAGCWSLGTSASSLNSSNGVTQISLGTNTTTYTIYNNEPVSIYRPLYPNVVSEGYINNPLLFPYRHRITLSGANTFMDISFANGDGNITQSNISASDTILMNGTSTAISMAACSFSVLSSNILRCFSMPGNYTGSWWGYVVGPQPMEGTTDANGNASFVGKFSIGPKYPNTTTLSNQFQVASTTAAGGVYLGITTGGQTTMGATSHLGFVTSTVSVTNGTVIGSDNGGSINASTSATQYALTFTSPFLNNPICGAWVSSGTPVAFGCVANTTNATFTVASALPTSTIFSYIIQGNSN